MDYHMKTSTQPPQLPNLNENSGDEEYWSENLSTGENGMREAYSSMTFFPFTFTVQAQNTLAVPARNGQRTSMTTAVSSTSNAIQL
jgi:hypothetical protein